ncbi:MAG: hypothetical protein U0670_10265 [Anaerolineae bacterium]
MTPAELSQLLMLYTWFALAALLFFLALIARFYEKFSGEITRYRWFIVPAALFGAATVRYASIDRIAGDWIGNVLMGIGGLFLLVLAAALYRQMTIGRHPVMPTPGEDDAVSSGTRPQ